MGDSRPRRTLGQRIWRPFMLSGFAVLRQIERLIARYSLVGNRPIFDTGAFSWIEPLERHWTVIREELDAILEYRESIPSFHEISADQVSITADDKWKTYFLYGYGFKARQNCARCPETTRLVEEIPGMMTAFFSILSPGKHIPAHRGPYKGLLRAHLGLVVPEPRDRCRIRIDRDVVFWEEGKGLVFDDTYDHEVWNDTDGVRVVLFLDVLRPLPPFVDRVNRAVIKAVARSPFVQKAKKNQEAWERRFENAVRS